MQLIENLYNDDKRQLLCIISMTECHIRKTFQAENKTI